MSNSADHLHHLYSTWRERVAGSPGANMGALIDLDGEGAAEVSAAFAWLHVIEDELLLLRDGGYKVKVYQRQLKRWMKVPLMVSTGWAAGVSTPDLIVDEATLDQIEGLSSFLDGKVITIDDNRMPTLRRVVDEAGALLTEDTTLDPALVSYIRRLLDAIRYALDDEAAGRLFDFSAAVQNLKVALQAAAESASSTEEKQSWRFVLQQFLINLGTALAVEGGKKIMGIES